MDCSLPGSPIHGILQARVLEWDAIPHGMEMQIKTTVRYHFLPVRMSTIKKDKTTKASKEMEKREPLYTVSGNINWYNHYENSTEVPQGIKNKTTINPTSEYIPKENKIIISKRLSLLRYSFNGQSMKITHVSINR